MLAQQQEQWTINALVHYNDWAACALTLTAATGVAKVTLRDSK
jgi:hypothetical protein